jgi:transcription initiation factor TFIIB
MATTEPYERCFDEDVQRPNSGCPECDGRVTTNTRETVCDDCGLVLADLPIDYGPEWRHFEEDETDPRRAGPPLTPTQHDGGLATEVGTHVDGRGVRLGGAQWRRANRLNREQSRTVRGQKRDQNRMFGNFEIGRICSGLELSPGIRRQACALFATAQAADLLQGRSIESIAAACVYAVCRLDQRPVTERDIRQYAHESGTSISWAYRTLNRELDLPIPPRQPREFVVPILDELSNGDQCEWIHEARRDVLELVDRYEQGGLAQGRNPRGIAAAAIYHVLRQMLGVGRVTQVTIAEAADVTPVTLRARWYELRDFGAGTEHVSRLRPESDSTTKKE